MLFSSISFLFWFLPLTLLLYFLPAPLFRSRARALSYQNSVLLVASLVFYAWGEPLYLLLMLGVILFDLLLAPRIAAGKRRRLWLSLAVFLHVSLLFYYKYAAFFAHVIGLSIQAPHLPLGISFYTFQSLSYLADVYWRRVEPERSPLKLGVYIALFPQLVAGPIVRYRDVAAALTDRKHSINAAASGARRFIVGLCKKLLLADPMGELFVLLIARRPLSAVGALTALLAFSLQLYFDFSGYSDMAIGLGRIFGFRFPENFRYPYIAGSITDFWRRWHITLSSFFKEYVYIPLGGNRRGVFRTVMNLSVVWVLTGLWHGAAWSFILWGVYYLLLLLGEKLLLPRLHVPTAIQRIGTPLLILLGWMLFAFDGSTPDLTLSAMGGFFLSLVGKNGFHTRADLYDLLRYLPLLSLCLVGATPLPYRIYRQTVCKKRRFWLSALVPLLGLFLSVAALCSGGFHAFLYFRF